MQEKFAITRKRISQNQYIISETIWLVFIRRAQPETVKQHPNMQLKNCFILLYTNISQIVFSQSLKMNAARSNTYITHDI